MSDTPAYLIRAAVWHDDEMGIAAVRRAVFIEEQGVPEALEWEAVDATCLWFVAEAGGDIIAKARLLPEASKGRIGRMAVMPAWRSMGVGRAILDAAIQAARGVGLERVELSAQCHAIPFYARAGFQAEGPEYPDAGIAHRHMYLELR